ncbi:MAG: S1 RNA-binding domain-containing protein [Fimbriiglobus sp.]
MDDQPTPNDFDHDEDTGELYQAGDRYRGIVAQIYEESVLVKIRYGVYGKLYRNHVSWFRRDPDLSRIFRLGQPVDVVVLDVKRHPKNDRLQLVFGYRELQDDPWPKVADVHPVGSDVLGRVTGFLGFGLLIELPTGFHAVVPHEELSWTERIEKACEHFVLGQELTVKIMRADGPKHRLYGSHRQTVDHPFDVLHPLHPVGSQTVCIIIGLAPYGLFLRCDSGLRVFVHITELSWIETKPELEKLYQVGQQLRVQIMAIDLEKKRVQASHRLACPNPWDEFLQVHPIGEWVDGTISNVKYYGLFVQTMSGYTGLLHVSQIPAGSTAGYEIGGPIRVCVLSFDRERCRVAFGLDTVLRTPPPSAETVETLADAP